MNLNRNEDNIQCSRSIVTGKMIAVIIKKVMIIRVSNSHN